MEAPNKEQRSFVTSDAQGRAAFSKGSPKKERWGKKIACKVVTAGVIHLVVIIAGRSSPGAENAARTVAPAVPARIFPDSRADKLPPPRLSK